MASQSIKRGVGALALVGAGILGYFLNGCEGFKTEKKKEDSTIIYNGDVTYNECCDKKDQAKVGKTTKPGKNKPTKDLEKIVDNTPASNTPCFDYIQAPISKPCLTDQDIVYQFRGEGYKYIGPGEDAEVPKIKNNGKIAKRRTETVKTYNFMSTDGKHLRTVPENRLDSWESMYKLVEVPCQTSQNSSKEIQKKEVTVVIVDKRIEQTQRQYAVAPGYNNISSFNLAIAGRNGAFVFNSMNANGFPMQMMAGNRVIGYNPTGYVLPANGVRFTDVELYGQMYNDPNGNTNVRMTTQPNQFQRAVNAQLMYSNR